MSVHTITGTINTSTDDAVSVGGIFPGYNTSKSTSSTYSSIGIGSSNIFAAGGMRFSSISIPIGATIISAVVQVCAADDYLDTNTSHWHIVCATGNANSGTFDGASRQPGLVWLQGITESYGDWDLSGTAWVSGDSYTSPDISGTIQEWSDGAWRVGESDPLIILMAHCTGTATGSADWERRIATYDSDLPSPIVVISYSTPSVISTGDAFYRTSAPDSGDYNSPSGYAFTQHWCGGVGGHDDLRVEIRHDLEDNWYPEIHQGFFYIDGTQERYLFARRQSASVDITYLDSGNQIPYATGTSVLLTGASFLSITSGASIFTYAPNTLTVYDNTTGWTQIPGTQYWTKGFTSSEILDIRGTSGTFRSRGSSGEVLHENEYYWDKTAETVTTIRHESDESTFAPLIYATYVRTGPLSPSPRQQELVTVDALGRVRTKYDHVYHNSDPTGDARSLYNPWIRRADGSSDILVTGVTSGNLLDAHASGNIIAGEQVAVYYWPRGTYCIVSGAGISTLHTVTTELVESGTGSVTLYWDDINEPWFSVSDMAPTNASKIQLNPTKAERRSGFLYLSTSVPTSADARFLSTAVSQSRVIDTIHRPRLVVSVVDHWNNPVPNALLASTLSGATLEQIYPGDSDTTSEGGTVHYLITPATGGVSSCSGTFAVSGNESVSGSWLLQVTSTGDYWNNSGFNKHKIFMYLDPKPDADGMLPLYINLCYPDGIWVNPLQSTQKITVTSENGSLHNPSALNISGYRSNGRVVDCKLAGIDRSARVLYLPSSGDRLYAETRVRISGEWLTVRSDYLKVD